MFPRDRSHRFDDLSDRPFRTWRSRPIPRDGIPPLTPTSPQVPPAQEPGGAVYIASAETARREWCRAHLGNLGVPLREFGSAAELLAAVGPDSVGCVVLDPQLPDMAGSDLIGILAVRAPAVIAVVAADNPPLPEVVQAMRNGAFDVLEATVACGEVSASVAAALREAERRGADVARRRDAEARVTRLTPPQRDVLLMAVEGQPNKAIATQLGVSLRTVERLRAAAFDTLRVSTLTEAVRVLREAQPVGS